MPKGGYDGAGGRTYKCETCPCEVGSTDPFTTAEGWFLAFHGEHTVIIIGDAPPKPSGAEFA